MTYAADNEGVNDLFYSVSMNMLKTVKHRKDFAFTDKQRAKQKRDKA
jgi:hypothetical protein